MLDEISTTRPKKKRGFAAMSPERQRELASMGGRSAHAQGRGRQFTSEEARDAGHKGGKAATASGKANRFTQETARAAGKKGINRKLNGHTNRTIHAPAPTRKEQSPMPPINPSPFNSTPTLPPGIKSADEPITMQQLAAALGSRRSGRPTSPETCRAWALHGVKGIFLESRLEVSIRLTSWRAYEKFRRAVEETKIEVRRRRKELARKFGKREENRARKAHARAKARLEAMGAR